MNKDRINLLAEKYGTESYIIETIINDYIYEPLVDGNYFDVIIQQVSDFTNVGVEQIRKTSREYHIQQSRKLFIYSIFEFYSELYGKHDFKNIFLLVNKQGIHETVANYLGITRAAVYRHSDYTYDWNDAINIRKLFKEWMQQNGIYLGKPKLRKND